MTIKNILLHIDRNGRNSARADLAISLAQQHSAHLIGLFAYPGPAMTYAYGEAYVAQEIMRRHEESAGEAAVGLRAEFEQRAGNAELSHEWRMEEEKSHTMLALQARYADLVVVSQTDPDAGGDGRAYNLAEEVVMASGTPTLAVPYAGSFDSIGKRVMVAWNGSRESSRAVRDALPILEAADQVIVYCVNPDHDHIPGAEIATHLARHGITTDAKHTVATDIDIGDAILGAVYDNSADLLVMGAYGHTRFREFVLGGATRHVMHHMTVPTLLSH